MPRARITALSVYPVKSCRGLSVADARVAARGLVAGTGRDAAWDREWLIGVTFGMNAIPVAGEGRTLSVGMDVEATFAF